MLVRSVWSASDLSVISVARGRRLVFATMHIA